MNLLEVNGLKTVFDTEAGTITAVDDVSFFVEKGEILGLVGESGSGKSVTAFSLLGLLPEPEGRVAAGEIVFDGESLLGLPKRRMQDIRGKKMSMIFQEPMTCLNPVFTIGDQIMEVILRHEKCDKKEAEARALQLLVKVGVPMPEKRLSSYPNSLSGGLRQRVMIAIALACNPLLLIADEPTTALDVTVQAQVIEMLKELIRDYDSALLMITHDLGLIAEIAERVIVMYAGQIVETGPVVEIFKRPLHPYTAGLIKSVPRIDRREELYSIQGSMPGADKIQNNCRFSMRCEYADDKCRKEPPSLTELHKYRSVRCWHCLP